MSTSRFSLNIVAVGPQRTASTWLYQALAEHPQLAFPEGVKETFFFDQRFEKGWDWYKWHYRNASEDALRSEVAPTYFDSELARQRLAELCSPLKVIISVRNPAERAVSLFRHHHSRGRVPADFEEAAQQFPSILAAGDYAEHAPKWEESFGPDNVFYLVQEDVADSAQDTLNKVCRFLGIELLELPESAQSRVNQSSGARYPIIAKLLSCSATFLRSYRLHWINQLGIRIGLKRMYSGGMAVSVGDEVVQALRERYEPHVLWLERRLGRSFAHWRSPVGEAGKTS